MVVPENKKEDYGTIHRADCGFHNALFAQYLQGRNQEQVSKLSPEITQKHQGRSVTLIHIL